MNNSFKKKASFLLALIVALCALSGYGFANADSLVAINFANFPDEYFRMAVADNYDLNEDGYLSESEANISTMLLSVIAQDDIESLKGIEHFPNLTSLYAGDLGIEDASDVASLSKLTKLVINGNALTSLDVSACTALTDLNCRGNDNLASLTLNEGLTRLQCDGCALSTLNVSACTGLQMLICYNNQLSALDLSKNTALSELRCSDNHLRALDLSKNTLLADSVTTYSVGNQTVEAAASFNGKLIYIPFTGVVYSRILSSNIPNPDPSADPEETYTGYDNNSKCFSFYDYDVLNAGIDYDYDVNAGSSEPMTVTVNVTKNFYKVEFLTAQGGSVIDYSFVNSGGSVNPPSFPEAPDGMVCHSWSGASTNITEDTTLWVNWAAEHSYVVYMFLNHTATERCPLCAARQTVVFEDCLHAKTGDDNFDPLLDANGDGVINTRDYAILAGKN